MDTCHYSFDQTLKPTQHRMNSNVHYGSAINNNVSGFPSGAVVESPPANAGDTGSSPGLGGSHMLRSN